MRFIAIGREDETVSKRNHCRTAAPATGDQGANGTVSGVARRTHADPATGIESGAIRDCEWRGSKTQPQPEKLSTRLNSASPASSRNPPRRGADIV